MGHFHPKKNNEINILFNGRSKTRQPLTFVGSEEKNSMALQMELWLHWNRANSIKAISPLANSMNHLHILTEPG